MKATIRVVSLVAVSAFVAAGQGALEVHVASADLSPVNWGRIEVWRDRVLVAAGTGGVLRVAALAPGDVRVKVIARGFYTAEARVHHDQEKTAVPILLQVGMISGNVMPPAATRGRWPPAGAGADKGRWIRFVPVFDGDTVTVSPGPDGAFGAKLPKFGPYMVIAVEMGRVCWRGEVRVSLGDSRVDVPAGCGARGME